MLTLFNRWQMFHEALQALSKNGLTFLISLPLRIDYPGQKRTRTYSLEQVLQHRIEYTALKPETNMEKPILRAWDLDEYMLDRKVLVTAETWIISKRKLNGTVSPNQSAIRRHCRPETQKPSVRKDRRRMSMMEHMVRMILMVVDVDVDEWRLKSGKETPRRCGDITSR